MMSSDAYKIMSNYFMKNNNYFSFFFCYYVFLKIFLKYE